MWNFPETNSEERMRDQSIKRGKWEGKETEKSIHLSVVLWPGKHLPTAGVQQLDLSSESPSLEPPCCLTLAVGTCGSSPALWLPHSPLLWESYTWLLQSAEAGRAFQHDSQLLPSRQICWPAGKVKHLLPHLHTMCPTPSSHMAAFRWKTPVSVCTDISRLQKQHTVLSRIPGWWL